MGPTRCRITAERCEDCVERVLGEAAVGLESGMIVLATAISGGPFIGLLGTVWGVMDTFPALVGPSRPPLQPWRRALRRRLIATVAGLMVAIPSLFCYNFLVTKTKTLTMELDNSRPISKPCS